MRATLAVEAQVRWSRRPPAVVPTVPIPFVVVSTLFAALDPTLPFLALGYNEGEAATFDECATYIQDAQTVTSWSVQLAGVALSGTQTLSFRIVIDGVPDATMPINLAVGDTGGVSDGTLAIPAGSLVAIEAVFGGGLAVKGVRGCVLALNGIPFIVESSRGSIVDASVTLMGQANTRAADGGDYEDGFSGSDPGGIVQPLPGDVHLTGLSIHAESVAVPPLSYDSHIGRGSAASTTTILPSATQDVAVDIDVVWPPNAVAGDCNDTMAYLVAPGAAGIVRTQYASRYLPNAPYAAYSIIISGCNAGTFSPGAPGTADTHTILGGDSGIPTTDLVSLRWPNLPGTFQHFVGYAKVSGTGTTAQFALAVNAVDQILTAVTTDSVIAGLIYARNDIDTIHVVSGDLVRFTQHVETDAFGGSLQLGSAIGFLPD